MGPRLVSGVQEPGCPQTAVLSPGPSQALPPPQVSHTEGDWRPPAGESSRELGTCFKTTPAFHSGKAEQRGAERLPDIRQAQGKPGLASLSWQAFDTPVSWTLSGHSPLPHLFQGSPLVPPSKQVNVSLFHLLSPPPCPEPQGWLRPGAQLPEGSTMPCSRLSQAAEPQGSHCCCEATSAGSSATAAPEMYTARSHFCPHQQ